MRLLLTLLIFALSSSLSAGLISRFDFISECILVESEKYQVLDYDIECRLMLVENKKTQNKCLLWVESKHVYPKCDINKIINRNHYQIHRLNKILKAHDYAVDYEIPCDEVGIWGFE